MKTYITHCDNFDDWIETVRVWNAITEGSVTMSQESVPKGKEIYETDPYLILSTYDHREQPHFYCNDEMVEAFEYVNPMEFIRLLRGSKYKIKKHTLV